MINIIILNWNSSKQVERLLISIDKSIYKKFRVILIDNNSSDILSLIEIATKYKNYFECHLIKNSSNLGYTGGNNSGYEYIKNNNLDGDLLIINPDVTLQPCTLSALNEAMLDDVAAVMVRTYDEKENLLYDRIKLNGFFQSKEIITGKISTTDYVAGSCMLLKRSLIDDMGLFNDKYYLYWEEVELSFRLKSTGYKLVTTTNSYVNREGNGESRNSDAYYYFLRNSFLLRKSEYTSFNIFQHLCFVIFSLASSLKMALKNDNTLCFKRAFNGVIDGLKNIDGKKNLF